MAKTKITSKKSQKNKQGKVKRTLGWLKPTTPAKGMLLFALVFGLAGGSYYISKSFAASYPRSFAANTIQSAQKGHCHIEYTGGTYLGIAYAKARIRSDYAGRLCDASIIVHSTSGGVQQKNSPAWSSTSWSPFYQAQLGPVATFLRGDALIQNVETGNYDLYHFTVY